MGCVSQKHRDLSWSWRQLVFQDIWKPGLSFVLCTECFYIYSGSDLVTLLASFLCSLTWRGSWMLICKFRHLLRFFVWFEHLLHRLKLMVLMFFFFFLPGCNWMRRKMRSWRRKSSWRTFSQTLLKPVSFQILIWPYILHQMTS